VAHVLAAIYVGGSRLVGNLQLIAANGYSHVLYSIQLDGGIAITGQKERFKELADLG